MRERLISCKQGCQRGPEWAVWSFCQRVSNFHGPHCGPLSCSWLDLNGPFDGPPEAFHRAPCHGARGRRGGSRHTTPGRYAKPRAQDKTKATLSSVYWELISSPPSFCIHKTQDGKEQDDMGQHSNTVSHRR